MARSAFWTGRSALSPNHPESGSMFAVSRKPLEVLRLLKLARVGAVLAVMGLALFVVGILAKVSGVVIAGVAVGLTGVDLLGLFGICPYCRESISRAASV